jgi:exopolysaccharide biosynthesis operon protein EpsL
MLSSVRSKIDASWTARATVVRRGPLWLLIGTMFSAPAVAAISKTVTPFVGVAYSYDDNVMRLSDDTVRSDKTRADTSRQIEAGLLLNKTIGQQVLSGKAAVTQVSFDHFDQLDYDGKDVLASWNWHLGNHVEGNLGASYVQVLAPYADFQIQERNLRAQRREFFDAKWRFHPSWQVRGGVSGDKISYDLPILRLSERTEDAIEAGLDYLVANGSTVGLQVRHLKSAYPNRRGDASLLGDGSFTQDELKAKIYWRYSAITQVQFLGGRVQRKHAFSASRDASGNNGRIKLDWAPLAKVRFSASAWREFAAVESAVVTNSLNKGGSLDSTWQPSAKLQLNMQLKGERRVFEGQSVFIPVPGLDMDDSTRRATLALLHQALPSMRLGASIFRETRSGSAALGLGSYRASGAMLNANIAF